MRHIAGIAVLLAVVGMAGNAVAAATLLMHYDVNDPSSWNGSQLVDLMSLGSSLTPQASTIAPGGAPVYLASGAGPGDRAYLDFQQNGFLGFSGKDQAIFNQPSGPKVGGYTMEGYFYIASTANGFNCTENSGLGFTQGTSHENQFIRFPRGTNPSRTSQSTVDNSAGGPHSPETVNTSLNSVVPLDQWFHIVKVHDPSAGEVRFYIDGAVQPGVTTALDPDNSAVEYHSRGEQYGSVGTNGRALAGIGYSMTKFYRGVLDPQEILTNFEELTTPPPTTEIPEPATMGLLGLGGLGALLRRRRKR